MSIYDRDYFQESKRPSVMSYEHVIIKLIVATVIIFSIQVIALRAGDAVTQWCKLDWKSLQSFQLWRLVTYAFLHDPQQVGHIFGNMLFLYIFGRHVEDRVGGKETLAFYFSAIIISGLAYVVISLLGDPRATYGASGAVCAIMFASVIWDPSRTILVFYIIPVPVWLFAAFYFANEFHPVLLTLGGQQVATGTAHACHLGGMVFGALYAWFNWSILQSRLAYAFSNKRSKRTFRKPSMVWLPRENSEREVDDRASVPFPKRSEPAKSRADQELETKLDQVLAKLHAVGMDQLTAAEREFLTEASRKLKDNKRG